MRRCSEIDSRSDLQLTLLPSFSQEPEPPPKRVQQPVVIPHTKKSMAAALKAQGRHQGPPIAFGQRVPPPRQPPAKAPAPPANAPAPAPAPAPVPAPAPLPSLDMPSFGGGQVQTWLLQSESQSLLQGPLPEPNLFNDSGSFEGVYGLPGSHSGHQQSLDETSQERRRQQYRYYKELRRMELQSPAVQGPNRSAARGRVARCWRCRGGPHPASSDGRALGEPRPSDRLAGRPAAGRPPAGKLAQQPLWCLGSRLTSSARAQDPVAMDRSDSDTDSDADPDEARPVHLGISSLHPTRSLSIFSLFFLHSCTGLSVHSQAVSLSFTLLFRCLPFEVVFTSYSRQPSSAPTTRPRVLSTNSTDVPAVLLAS